jgi:hypothetical protein
MLKAWEGRYGLVGTGFSPYRVWQNYRPLGPEVCSSRLLLPKTVPQGLKATSMTTFIPGINPRPTLKTTLSITGRVRTYQPFIFFTEDR